MQYSVFYNLYTSESQISFVRNDLIFDKFGEYNLSPNFLFGDSHGFYGILNNESIPLFIEEIENGNITSNLDRIDDIKNLTDDPIQ